MLDTSGAIQGPIEFSYLSLARKNLGLECSLIIVNVFFSCIPFFLVSDHSNV